MKGFRDTSKMMQGHNFARGGHTLQPHFGQMHPAPGPATQSQGRVEGTTGHGVSGEGHSAVMRSPMQPTQELTEHGGKTPLTGGYKKGGKTQHFHVHKHYHSGGKVSTVSKSYLKGMEMQAESGNPSQGNGGFPSGTTGKTQNKLAKGGKMHINPAHEGKFTKKMTGSKKGHLTGSDVERGLHSKSGETRKEANFARMARRGFKPLGKADGGHIHDDTHEVAPDFATGGTINRVATGGTINRLGAGGALYARGGNVSGEAAARKVIKEHINYPAPQGHKGLGEMIKRGR